MPRQQLRGLLFAICALAALAATPRETPAEVRGLRLGALTCRLIEDRLHSSATESMECRFQPAGPIRQQALPGSDLRHGRS